MAVHTLAKAGKKVTVLEARSRCRIHILNQEMFFKNAELGAEFVLGDLPVTLNLLNEAGIPYHSANAEMWHYRNGKFSREGEFNDWDKVVEKLKASRAKHLNSYNTMAQNTKTPLHSLLGGFQPKPYHNYKCENAFIHSHNAIRGFVFY